ncbi:MAG: O-antigen ligase family protein [Solirubrobacterales bacterium]
MDRQWLSLRVPLLIPGLLGIGIFAVWSRLDAGFEPTVWYPGTIFLLGALIATVLTFRGRTAPLPRLASLAAALLAAFTLWSFLSILWADVPADAWDGANRTLLYLVVYLLFATPQWRAEQAATLFGAYGIAIGAVAVLTLLDILGSATPVQSFIDGRLIDPAGYQNASAALLIGGLWPALLLSSRRETPWQLRGLFLAIAGLLAQLAVLPQSRGAVLVLPIALFLYLAIVPSRLRTLAVMLPVGVGVALTAPRMLDVSDTIQARGDLSSALDNAASAIGICCLALLILGTALAFVDSRRRLSPAVRTGAGRTALVLACLAGAGALAAGIAAVGDPIDWAGERIDNFKGGYNDDLQANRFSGDLGNNRYDYWRVGLGTTFADSPLIGAGADNFETDYLLERKSDEEPRYPHSLPVRVLAGTGLVGGVLLAGFLLCAVASALRRARRGPPGLPRAVGGAAIVAIAYWFMHSAGDWLWSFPAVTAPAFAWLAIAATMGTSDPPSEPERRPLPLPRLVLGIICGALILAIVGSLLAPWLSARYVDSATGSWKADPDNAYEQLDRARRLNPLSGQPDLLAGAIATRLGDLPRASDSFAAAVEREPLNWYARLEFGVASALEGDPERARFQLNRAHELNPLDPLVAEAARRVAQGREISFSEIDRAVLERLCKRFGQTSGTPSCRR